MSNPNYLIALRGLCLAVVVWAGTAIPLNAQTPEDVTWKTFSLGEPPLHISLPAELTPMEAAVPGDMINEIQRFDTYRLYAADGKVVGIFKFIDLSKPLQSTAAQQLTKELDEVMKSIDAKFIMQKEEDKVFNHLWGRIAHGSFALKNKFWISKDVVIVGEKSIWQIWLAAEGTDQKFSNMLQKIYTSIGF